MASEIITDKNTIFRKLKAKSDNKVTNFFFFLQFLKFLNLGLIKIGFLDLGFVDLEIWANGVLYFVM